MRCITRIIFVGFLTLQTENHRGVMISAVLPKSYPPYIKCLLFNEITCAFLQVFYRMRCITRMIFVGSLTLQTENHRGVMISAVLPKSYPPYIKCLILIIITCAFLQVFYRMRCITRIIFVGFLTLQTENHRGVMISAVLPKSYPPYIKCLLFNIITCAFLQVFYRMRCITRMSFIIL